MPTFQKPKSETLSLLIALSILNMVGFLVLYYKVDLSATFEATDAGLLSQQLARIENRLNKVERSKTAPATGSTIQLSPVGTAFGQTTWNGLKIMVPQRAIEQQIIGTTKIILPTATMNQDYCGGASTPGCVAGMTVTIESVSDVPIDASFQSTDWKNIKEEVLDGVGSPRYILTTKNGKVFVVVISGSATSYKGEVRFDFEDGVRAVLSTLAQN